MSERGCIFFTFPVQKPIGLLAVHPASHIGRHLSPPPKFSMSFKGADGIQPSRSVKTLLNKGRSNSSPSTGFSLEEAAVLTLCFFIYFVS